jgi:protein gp37
MRHRAFLDGKKLPVQYAKPFDQLQMLTERLEDPLHWRTPQRIFVNSVSDLFHPEVPYDFIGDVFQTMSFCPQHTFMVLTKRPKRIFKIINEIMLALKERPLPNLWLGVSVEDQNTAEERIPWLLETPAAVRFISVEPMLGPVNLARVRWARIAVDKSNYDLFGAPAPDEIWSCRNVLQSKPGDQYNKPMIGLNWIICGGESGPDARPMNPDWARSLRDQCVAGGVPFFFKSWGRWVPFDQTNYHNIAISPKIEELGSLEMIQTKIGFHERLLDGEQWDQFPEFPGVASAATQPRNDNKEKK